MGPVTTCRSGILATNQGLSDPDSERPHTQFTDGQGTGNSPDLKTEKVCAWMKMQLKDSNSNITNLDQLKQEFIMFWVTRMEDSLSLKKLVGSMSQRPQEVTDTVGTLPTASITWLYVFQNVINGQG